jgi:hypothetical protein
MKPLAVFLAASLGAGVVLWWAIDDSAGAGASAPGPEVSARAAPRSPAVGVTARAATRPALAPAQGAPSAPAEPPAPERSLDDQAVEAIAARRDQLQTRFAAQAVDRAWASDAQRALGDDLATHATPDVRIQSVECRTSLCRVDLAPTSSEAAQGFVQSWIRHRTWTGPGFVSGDGDAVVVFVARADRPEAFAAD